MLKVAILNIIIYIPTKVELSGYAMLFVYSLLPYCKTVREYDRDSLLAIYSHLRASSFFSRSDGIRERPYREKFIDMHTLHHQSVVLDGVPALAAQIRASEERHLAEHGKRFPDMPDPGRLYATRKIQEDLDPPFMRPFL